VSDSIPVKLFHGSPEGITVYQTDE